MSALRKLRQLKLQQQQQSAQDDKPLAVTDAQDEERNETNVGTDDASATATAVKRNAFDMLMEEEEEEDEDVGGTEKEKEGDEEGDDNATDETVDRTDEHEAAEPPSPGRVSAEQEKRPIRQKNKKKKKGGGEKQKAASKPKVSPTADAEVEDWELEFGVAASTSGSPDGHVSNPSTSPPSSTDLWSFLSTDPRSLDAATEVRAVFGGRMDRLGGGGGGDEGADGGGVGGGGLQIHEQRGGFRRGGAAQRRARKLASATTTSSSSSSSSWRRLLIRPSAQWPRTEERGLISVRPVAVQPVPVQPTRSHSKGSGMHGNIHSLPSTSDATASTAASSSSADAMFDAEARAESDYRAALERYRRQQLLALTPGAREFTFFHSPEFVRINEEYAHVVATHDVQALAMFARHHPFHPEALLTLCDIYASQSEYATAHDLLQRCIYLFENGARASLVGLLGCMEMGLARMDADRSENTPFFQALAKHAQMLGKKGLVKTALAVCRLLLALNPLVDPTATLLSIDYYALRARQYEFLKDFAEKMDRAVISAYPVGQHPWATRKEEKDGNVSSSSSAAFLPSAPRTPCTFLPNLLYSRALAVWHMEREAAEQANDKSKKKKTSAASSSSAAPPSLYTGVVKPPTLPTTSTGHSMLDAAEAALLTESSDPSHQSSSYLLQQALLMWPNVVQSLMQAAGNGNAVQRDPWSTAINSLTSLYTSSSFFSASSSSNIPSSTPYLAKLEMIYSERTGSLWKGDRISRWLLEHLQHLATAVQSYPTDVLESFRQARHRFLLALPFPHTIKSLQKSAYTDQVPHLPPELLMAQANAAAAIDVEATRRRMQEAAMEGAGLRPLNLDQHPLRVFLQSLLPWFTPPAGAGAEGGAEGEEVMPENVDEVLAQLHNLPQERRDALMQRLFGDLAGAAVDEEDEDGENEQGGDGQGGINYEDYQFDD